MKTLVTVLMLASAFVVMRHGLCLVAHLSPKRWMGRKAQFFGLGLATALMCGGAVGVLLGWVPSGTLMLVGLALFFISDRRM